MRAEPRARLSARRRLFYTVLGVFVLILLVTAFFGKKGAMDIARTRRAARDLQAEVERLEAERARLAEEIAELERNPQAVEREAREKLWLVRPDETVVILKDKQEPPRRP